mmetsp:Transcript_107207/g.335385  ORF Transcript_107207/g.335385 Transcript_107207/m.335385 type:complete len:234 (+) Transcript_107207:725-1426(+)
MMLVSTIAHSRDAPLLRMETIIMRSSRQKRTRRMMRSARAMRSMRSILTTVKSCTPLPPPLAIVKHVLTTSQPTMTTSKQFQPKPALEQKKSRRSPHMRSSSSARNQAVKALSAALRPSGARSGERPSRIAQSASTATSAALAMMARPQATSKAELRTRARSLAAPPSRCCAEEAPAEAAPPRQRCLRRPARVALASASSSFCSASSTELWLRFMPPSKRTLRRFRSPLPSSA